MLVASHFLLWIAVILLGTALFAIDRQVRALRQGAAGTGDSAPPAPAASVPVISATTLAGETMTIGRASRDGRALLLLFLQGQCARSASALREVLALADPARLRPILLGEGDAEALLALARLHHLGDADIILDSPIAAAMGIAQRPVAVLIDPGGTMLASGTAHSRDQIAALLAMLPASAPVARPRRARAVAGVR